MTQGYKTQFQRSDDGGTSYDQVAGLKELEVNEITRGSDDVTTIDSIDGYKRFNPSPLKDAGELSVTLLWDKDDAQQVLLKSDLENSENQKYRILFPDSTTASFDGHITSWGQSTPIEETITRMVKFKISGKPVIA